jgi:hypothetical protein
MRYVIGIAVCAFTVLLLVAAALPRPGDNRPKPVAPAYIYTPPSDPIHGAKWKMTYWGTNYGVSLAGFKITAPKTNGVRDFRLECRYAGATSDTIIRTTAHMLYEAVPAGKTRTFNAINLGFAPPNAHRGGCDIVGATAF